MFLSFIRKNYFIFCLIAVFLLLNAATVRWDPVNRYGFFYQNDFSKTKQLHPGEPWHSVFFGSSIVTASYREDLGRLGLINVGLDYGKVTDLESILTKGYMKVTDRIVLGLNYMTLMDNLPTNPFYQWHRKAYVPYVFFYRTPIRWYLERDFKAFVQGKPLFTIEPTAFQKELYYGVPTDEQIQQKIKNYDERFGKETIDDFQENLKSLQRVIDFCRKSNIEIKCVWMPVNPVYELPQYAKDVKLSADDILKKNNIETLDWTHHFGPEYFADLVHMNWDKGAIQFTGEIEKWLEK